ncbi:MAG: AAA family ATPase [Spirochaetes bacterium]|jgi:lon-related putative ATP-dependent protease|nr:AAA family ATPase [Spirochaetota bacterium]
MKLTAQQARRHVDPSDLSIESTREADRISEIIGQDRALKALQFGLQVDGKGYNIYVSGPPGIGKMTSVESYLERVAAERDTPRDWCFVYNLQDPYQPRAVGLPSGKGNEFKSDMQHLREVVERDIPGVFQGEEYSRHREEALSDVQERGQEISRKIQETAQEKGFVLQSTVMGTAAVPVKDGQPLRDEDLQQLPQGEREEIERKRQGLQKEIRNLQKDYRRLDREAREKVNELDRQVVQNRIEGPFEDLREKYEGSETVCAYLDEMQQDILDNVETLKESAGQQEQQGQMNPQVKRQLEAMREQFFKKYDVNVIVDHSRRSGAPVVVELNPNYNNLVGRIEKEMQMGALNTDFTLIKPGALLQANGGFLVLPVEDVLRNVYSWDALKRALRSGELRIEEGQEQLGLMSIKTLRPQPIPLNLKVILIGKPMIYYLLQKYDDDFQELFRVKADYDVTMDAGDENTGNFIGFISHYCEREGLLHFSREGAAKMLEYAARRADHKEKLSTEFGNISDVLREASFWAADAGAQKVDAEHVNRALEEKVYRSNLIKMKIQELIDEGTLLIDTADSQVGQVNGLAVVSLGDYSFGRPNRITATAAPGRSGVVDIEREAKLGGPVHSKGVLILTGYLSNTFSRTESMSMSGRVVFEQSYQGVEGDSASSAELYALLSALSGAPISQSIAVTGSVNQHGEIQAVGGINEKIEGFFDVCSLRGLDGSQGVIIPRSNEQNLMLREDVVEAIDRGDFNVWAVSTVAEGIEQLTGWTAGEYDESSGEYPEGSVFANARRTFASFAETLQKRGNNSDRQGRENARPTEQEEEEEGRGEE